MLLNSIYLVTVALAGTQVIHAQPTCAGGFPSNDLCLERLEVDIDETHGFAECENALKRVQDTAVYQQIRDAADAASGSQALSYFMGRLRRIPNEDFTEFCTYYRTDLRPCLSSQVESFVKQVETDNPCCANSNLNELAEAVLGKSATALLEFGLDAVDDLVCNLRIPKSVVESKPTCGYTLVQGMQAFTQAELIDHVKDLVEIPHDQTCAAFNGDIYTNTRGKLMRLMVASPLGNCATGLDKIFTMAKNMYEALQTSSEGVAETILSEIRAVVGNGISQALRPGECYAPELDELLSAKDADMVGDVCINVPSGFSEQCGFETEVGPIGGASSISLFTSWSALMLTMYYAF